MVFDPWLMTETPLEKRPKIPGLVKMPTRNTTRCSRTFANPHENPGPKLGSTAPSLRGFYGWGNLGNKNLHSKAVPPAANCSHLSI